MWSINLYEEIKKIKLRKNMKFISIYIIHRTKDKQQQQNES